MAGMPLPVHPLAKAHLDKLAGLSEEGTTAGEEELERRAQMLWNAFLKTYLTGSAVDLADGAGGVMSKTFEAVHLLYGTQSPPKEITLPILHMIVADRRQLRRDRVAGAYQVKEAITRNLLVRVPSQAAPESTADEVPKADLLCRKVADQVRWLLNSDEVQSLALKGVGKVEVVNGPREIAAGAWHMRQIVTTEEWNYEIRRNEP